MFFRVADDGSLSAIAPCLIRVRLSCSVLQIGVSRWGSEKGTLETYPLCLARVHNHSLARRHIYPSGSCTASLILFTDYGEIWWPSRFGLPAGQSRRGAHWSGPRDLDL